MCNFSNMNLILLNLIAIKCHFSFYIVPQMILKQHKCLIVRYSILCRNDYEKMKRIAQLGYTRVSDVDPCGNIITVIHVGYNQY